MKFSPLNVGFRHAYDIRLTFVFNKRETPVGLDFIRINPNATRVNVPDSDCVGRLRGVWVSPVLRTLNVLI